MRCVRCPNYDTGGFQRTVEVSGAAHAPAGPDGTPVTLVRIEGFQASVAYRAEELKEMLGGYGTIRIESDPEATAALWRWVRDAEALAGSQEDVWRISVKPSDGRTVAEALSGARLMFDWGGGLIWAGVAPGTDVRMALADITGHATLVRAAPETVAELGTFQPEPAPLAAISSGLRQKFDPRGILNPGLMG